MSRMATQRLYFRNEKQNRVNKDSRILRRSPSAQRVPLQISPQCHLSKCNSIRLLIYCIRKQMNQWHINVTYLKRFIYASPWPERGI